MTVAHTPGPWITKAIQTHDTPGHVVLWKDTSKSGVHTRRLDYKGTFTEADARLIAAAPDLLAALEHAHMALTGYLPTHSNAITAAAIEHARVAIAKATEVQS